MNDEVIYLLGWIGMYAPMALGAIGSIVGCAIAGQTACGAMLDVEGGYGRFIGVSAMPSSQTIYGIVVMFTLQTAASTADGELVLNAQNAGGLFGVGVLSGLALLISAVYQGRCLSSSINVSKSKPEVFGLSIAPAAIVEGFAVFAFVFALVLAGALPEVKAAGATEAAAQIGEFLTETMQS
jgi:V/A-type H+-transporting ATPase subunit K